MKINNDSLSVVERNGISSDGAFKIEFNAKMAKILSDGLYSDKIGSIIRELCCNAIDSHVEAGINRPIEVHLPNQFEPYFYVQDFGVGLDNRQVEDIYTVYGTSTKTNSNEFVGQLGLGSKSPFSYVDAFDVTVRKHGKEWQYSMYKSEDGMPKAALLGEHNTNESNGVIVKLPVKRGDESRFLERSIDIFTWFGESPKVVGVSEFKIPTIDIQYQGNGWKIRKGSNGYRYGRSRYKPVAIMGRIAYPIDIRNILNIKQSHISACELPFILEFDIGDLEVSASRESLSYDPRTQKNILDRIERMIVELGSKFDKDIATATTEWEARQAYGHIFDNNDFRYELSNLYNKQGFKWKNLVINSSEVEFDTTSVWDAGIKPPIYKIDNNRKRAQLMYNYNNKYNFACSKKIQIVFDDLTKGGLSRATYYRETLNLQTNSYGAKEHVIILIGASKHKTFAQLAKILGSPKYMLTSQLPKKPIEKSERIKVLKFYENQRNKTDSWISSTIDTDKGGIFVLLDGYTPVRMANGIKHEIHNFNDIVEKAKKIGIFSSNVELYSPRAEFRKKFANNPKWQEFTDKIATSVGKLLTPALLQEIADMKEYQKCQNEYRPYGIWSNPQRLSRLDQNGICYKLATGMISLEASFRKVHSGSHQLLIDIAKWLGTEVTVVPPSFVSTPLFNEFDRRYPLIKLAGGKYSSPDINPSNIDVYLDYIIMCDEKYKGKP